MRFRWRRTEHLELGRYALKWLCIAAPVGLVTGSAVALFLASLDWATAARWRHPWLLFLLPAAGAAIGAMYHRFGRSVEAGSNLIVDQIHEPGGGVPARMAPLVLIGTLVTHLFGGSAGREGTAVQMGGSLASTLGRAIRLRPEDTRTLLMAGVAGGFGAVFGTPLTGAVFAIEVLAIGQMRYEALVPCLVASVAGDWACGAWGIHHTAYRVLAFTGTGLAARGAALDWLLAGKVALAGVAFGLAGLLFAEMAHGLQRGLARLIPSPVLRPVAGGLAVIALVYLLGAWEWLLHGSSASLALGVRDYLGLGVTSPDPREVTILSAFTPGEAAPWSWWWKLLFTAVTLSSGFKGGEVTPLFYVGAALGNTLAVLLGAPVDLFAGLGFVAVFAGATNTPLACTIMGIELFGAGNVVYVALACFLAFLFSGHSGIYLSQRVGVAKIPSASGHAGASLRDLRVGREEDER